MNQTIKEKDKNELIIQISLSNDSFLPNNQESKNNKRTMSSKNSKNQLKNESKLLSRNPFLTTKVVLNSNPKNVNNKILNSKKKINSYIKENSYNKINNQKKILQFQKQNKIKEDKNENDNSCKNVIYKNEKFLKKIDNSKVKLKSYKKKNMLDSKIMEVNKNEKIDNDEKPEDISDYINIDKNIYNENYTDLNQKNTNEAIEEVEEAKEASDIKQSLDYYNNMSSSEDNLNYNTKFSKEDINRVYSFKNKNILNRKEKIIHKLKNFKYSKNIIFPIKILDSKESLRSNDNIINKTNENLSSTSKDNFILKSNYYLFKLMNSKNKSFINSYKSKEKEGIIFKKINNNSKNKSNQFNKKNNIILKNNINSEKNNITSRTTTNLKKFIDIDIEKKKANNRIYEKNKINKKQNNDKKNKIKNNNYREKNYNSTKTENNKYKNLFTNKNKEICQKYNKYFRIQDNNKELNKTNDRINFLSNNSNNVRIEFKSIKKSEGRFHKFFKDYYLNLNNSKDIKNKK